MKKFMDKDFLLTTDTAKHLFHDFAENMPIIDYHCHLSPQEIAEDAHFDNITQVWLGGDHYKWRQMRSNGVEERYITGDASDREKFQKWAETLEMAIGNPLYHWSHLELQRYFGYTGALNGDTAEEVWNLCNEKLKTMSARQLILDSNVEMIGTTDDPIDDLHWHKMIAADETFNVKVLPSWRPDKAVNIEKDMMNSEIGFGRKVLEEFEKQGISFEHIPSGIDTMSIVVHQDEFEEKEQKVLTEIKHLVHPDVLDLEPDIALIAIVGRGMREARGTAGRIFSALAHAKVNVKMIDQGSSEINIIVGVKNSEFETAIKAIYDIFVVSQL